MKTLAINLNQRVLVRINPLGEDLYRIYYERMNLEPPPLRRDGEGYVCFELWRAMHIFGPAMECGFDPPIETTIHIVLTETP